MFIFILVYFFYKLIFNKELHLNKRTNQPKICVYITNQNYNSILEMLSLQNYPKNLFDVYVNNYIDVNYNFNVYEYNKDKIIENNYDLISIIDSTVDINYLNFISQEYLKGYDIVISNSSSILNTLVNRNLSRLYNNKIFSNNFSFIFSIYKENIIDLRSTNLSNFVSKKSSLISYNKSIKTLDKLNSLVINNPFSKGLSLLFLYTFINIFFFLLITNKLVIVSIYLYIFILIENGFFLYKNYTFEITPIIIAPFKTILNLRINNK